MSSLRSRTKSVLKRLRLLETARTARRWFAEQRFQRYYSQRDLYEVKIHGNKVAFSTEDKCSGRWFFPRYNSTIHEPKATELLARLAQDVKNIIDVGANLGWFTCIAASITSGIVHAFELDRDNLRRLTTNVTLNELYNVRVKHTAITNSRGNVCYRKELGSAGVGHSLVRDNRDAKLRARVTATTLDRYTQEHCQSVDLLKIDVEGAEKHVLHGGRQTVQENNPHILLEVHPTLLGSIGTSVQEVLDELPDAYRIYRVEDFKRVGQEVSWQPIDPSVFNPSQVAFLYAEPPKNPLSNFSALAGPPYEII